ncbi:alpha/beta hydrolase family esterase [Actinomadura viridis]|uniref:alpha/beta hydrolase family esterase n=1 Tax=Actinomadura viridis TaxID=58110 RepID=UPI00368CC15B
MGRPVIVALTGLLLAVTPGCARQENGGERATSPRHDGVRHSQVKTPRTGVHAGRRAVPSAGCSRRAPLTGRHAFRGRSYLLKRPRGDGRFPAPLIIDLHGLRSSAFLQALYARMSTQGSARGFIVVQPESARGRSGWKLPGMRGGRSDIRYVRGLLDHLERRLCVDRAREYATGFSNGAGLAAALVCGLGGRLAGVAPVAGLNLARPCPGARPTTIVAFHGTADRTVPYRGGEPYNGDRTKIPAWMRPADGAFALPPVPAVARQWARSFQCATAVRGSRGDGVGRLSHPGCRNGARVELYTIEGGGHIWPGAFRLGGGAARDQINATTTILNAFSRSA